MNETSLTVGVRDGAAVLGVGVNSLYQAIRAGSVNVLRVGRKIRIPRVELEEIARNPECFRRVRKGKGFEG